jgi:signal transduction histidine kinase/GAF domain-containing protein
VLQVINANPGNLTPVFDAILEKAHSLCGAVIGSLLVYDGEHFRAIAGHGHPERVATFLATPFRPNAFLQRLVDGEPIVHVADFAAAVVDPKHGLTRGTIENTQVRTSLWVPLRKDGTLLGCISAFREEVRVFSDKEIALLENFAAQAVIAIDNARLLTEQHEALDRQTATAEVLQVINSSPGNLMPVFDAILEKARRLCGADVGALGFYDGAMFRSVAMHGFPEAHAARARQPWVPTPHQDPLVRGERMVHVADLKAEGPEWDNDITRSANAGTAIRTGLWLPLRKDGVLQGYISSFRNSVRPFSDNEILLLENFAEQAVIAIENARLLNEIQQRQEELRITFENMGDGVSMFDETQHLVAWNRKFQEIFNVPDALLEEHRTYAEYVRYLGTRGDFGPTVDVEEQIRRFTETAGEYHSYERVRPDGRVLEIRHNPVPSGGFVLIYADITERKRNEAEIRAAHDAAQATLRDLKAAQANLIQAEKMASLGQLTAGIAHEIKNPLNFVNNFATLSVDLLSELKETAAPGFAALTKKQRAEVEDVSAMLTSNLEKINEHGKRADGIVKAMLEHSRGSSGERRKVDINTLADEAVNLAYHGARAQDQTFNITLERDFGEEIDPIEINPQDITRVFLNLFANGFYAVTRRAREGGDAGFVPTLTVTTMNAGEAVEIRVRDNGTGIQADIRDKLFQPFFTTKPTGEGTGLGLSITYDIVTKAHGGSIAVDSKVGDYSEFTIRLPRNL